MSFLSMIIKIGLVRLVQFIRLGIGTLIDLFRLKTRHVEELGFIPKNQSKVG